jgi:hypothetical protein
MQNEFDKLEVQFVTNKFVTDTKRKHNSQNPLSNCTHRLCVSALWIEIMSDFAAILMESN